LFQLLEKQTNLTIGGYSLQILPKKFIELGISHYFTHLVTIVPPGRPYTSTEKLLLPFSTQLWLTIIGVLVVEAVVHSGLIRFRTETYLTNVCLNLFSVTVGTVATSVPKSGSGRIMFISFALYCLVMRSVYLTKLYEFMSQMKNRSQIQSYPEAFDEGFHFYTEKVFMPIFDLTPNAVKR
jgi:hypothetical protein